MDYTPELTSKIVMTAWQCTNCKTCSVCSEANPEEDEQMLFCDSCDHGYHMSCHKPKVEVKPGGKWICFKCKPRTNGKAVEKKECKIIVNLSHLWIFVTNNRLLQSKPWMEMVQRYLNSFLFYPLTFTLTLAFYPPTGRNILWIRIFLMSGIGSRIRWPTTLSDMACHMSRQPFFLERWVE